jgi:hypothetical protein
MLTEWTNSLSAAVGAGRTGATNTATPKVKSFDDIMVEKKKARANERETAATPPVVSAVANVKVKTFAEIMAEKKRAKIREGQAAPPSTAAARTRTPATVAVAKLCAAPRPTTSSKRVAAHISTEKIAPKTGASVATLAKPKVAIRKAEAPKKMAVAVPRVLPAAKKAAAPLAKMAVKVAVPPTKDTARQHGHAPPGRGNGQSTSPRSVAKPTSPTPVPASRAAKRPSTAVDGNGDGRNPALSAPTETKPPPTSVSEPAAESKRPRIDSSSDWLAELESGIESDLFGDDDFEAAQAKLDGSSTTASGKPCDDDDDLSDLEDLLAD